MIKNIQYIDKLYLLLLTFFCLNNPVYSQSIHGSFESKFKRYKKNEQFSGTPTQNWNAVAWKGERIHKQIVLWADTNINGLSYSISDLTKGNDQIASSKIKLRFGKYIKGDPEAKTCSAYPTHPIAVEIADALSDETVSSITSTDPLKLWLTFDVPSSALVGVYLGTITVNGGANSLIFNIELRIVDYTLPDVVDWSFHLDLWQFPVNILNHYNSANPSAKITIWSDDHFALLEPAYKFLADSGQKAITTYIKDDALGAESMIKWTKKINGTWEYDFSAFDKYVNKLMSWGITKQIDCFSPVGWNEAVIPYWDEATNTTVNLSATLGSITYNMRWDHFLSAFKIHLDGKGWFDKVVLYLDEISESKLNNVVSMVFENDPNWKLGIAYSHGLSNASKANFYDLSGILEDASNEGISEEKISTFYTSCTQIKPNNYITPQNNPAEMTWMAWHAFKEGYDGYLRWAFDNWKLNDSFDARDGAHTAGDFSMIYRGSNDNPSQFLSGIRFEMLREGIQDYEKLKILKARLEGSTDPYGQEILKKLNDIINNFEKTSGTVAKQLVLEGQKAIEEIVMGTFLHCKVNGGTNTEYYIKSITTTGGTTNLNFSTNQYPNTGYEHPINSKISLFSGDGFMLNLTNSSASNCARSKVWIDWNNDKDFDDLGEEVFHGGIINSCTNSINYSIPITVPSNITNGIKRIRIQVRKSDENIPEPCGVINKSGTADFDLEIIDSYCTVIGTGSYNANEISTMGGIKNIIYSGVAGKDNYTISTQKISIPLTKSFDLSVTNSNGWSRSIVWIDWNGDGDFEDIGERLTPLSPEKISTGVTPTYTINVIVPENATIGTTKIRIVTGDAWTYQDSAIPDTPCGFPTLDGTMENSAIKDFYIEIVAGSLGINDLNKMNNVHIYPNPFKTEITIRLKEPNSEVMNLSIFDIKGQLIFKEQHDYLNTSVKIKIPNSISKGFYFLKIITDRKIYEKKLVKY